MDKKEIILINGKIDYVNTHNTVDSIYLKEIRSNLANDIKRVMIEACEIFEDVLLYTRSYSNDVDVYMYVDLLGYDEEDDARFLGIPSNLDQLYERIDSSNNIKYTFFNICKQDVQKPDNNEFYRCPVPFFEGHFKTTIECQYQEYKYLNADYYVRSLLFWSRQ